MSFRKVEGRFKKSHISAKDLRQETKDAIDQLEKALELTFQSVGFVFFLRI